MRSSNLSITKLLHVTKQYNHIKNKIGFFAATTVLLSIVLLFFEKYLKMVNNAYFVVVPSEWYENNPMTIIEAYSVGTPVIGAYIGGIPEIVIDGYTGFRFKSGNADDLHNTLLKAVALDDKAYMKLSRGTINFANDNLSKESYWTKLIAFYDQFVAIT